MARAPMSRMWGDGVTKASRMPGLCPGFVMGFTMSGTHHELGRRYRQCEGHPPRARSRRAASAFDAACKSPTWQPY